MKTFQWNHKGFTLAEMAVVVLLIGIAMTMGLKMVTATLQNTAYSETKAKQERIKMALIGYLRTNGHLPCPDSATGIATGSAPATCTSATEAYGVFPWQTLGIARDAAQDGWGNFFTYRVANFNPAPQITPFTASPPLHRKSNQNWTIKTGAGAFDIVSLSDATAAPGYQSLRIESGGGTAESHTAVAVILSHGKNGFGAKTIKIAARMSTTGAGADETTNAANNTTTFVRRATTTEYDDLVAYMTPQDLLQPLIHEGTLKTCREYCPYTSGSASTPTCPSGNPQKCNDHTDPTCSGTTPTCSSGEAPTCPGGSSPTCASSVPTTPPVAGCTTTTDIPVGAFPISSCP
jgi:prepilin-type N-terminal cleavage/methylation domain-containing protein